MRNIWRPFRIQLDVDVHQWVCASAVGAPGKVDSILQRAFDEHKINAPAPCLELPHKRRRQELLVGLPDLTLKILSFWAKRNGIWGTHIARALLQEEYEDFAARIGNSSTRTAAIATMGDGEDR